MRPVTMPGDPGRALVSMGNYLFEPGLLGEVLAAGASTLGLDFGRHVIPTLVRRRLAWAYDFRRNTVPAARPCEEPAYWRDVGTLQAYRHAQQDACGSRPRFVLDDPCWPIPATLPGTARRVVPAPAAALI